MIKMLNNTLFSQNEIDMVIEKVRALASGRGITIGDVHHVNLFPTTKEDIREYIFDWKTEFNNDSGIGRVTIQGKQVTISIPITISSNELPTIQTIKSVHCFIKDLHDDSVFFPILTKDKEDIIQDIVNKFWHNALRLDDFRDENIVYFLIAKGILEDVEVLNDDNLIRNIKEHPCFSVDILREDSEWLYINHDDQKLESYSTANIFDTFFPNGEDVVNSILKDINKKGADIKIYFDGFFGENALAYLVYAFQELKERE